eukprot:TRINITY_DN10117_c0_g1_i3.p1 TRINITY_DN10117_c0_g1~~TRINITY_DN10117_c0_g1_i3.p1  ORF type:complete len:156 (+),score=24.57 TRINITY_DN10117_c0_g1_i3:133-600(+)
MLRSLVGSEMCIRDRYERVTEQPVTLSYSAGDVVLFDYRILHRGLKHLGEQRRPMMYHTFSARWFDDKLNFPSRHPGYLHPSTLPAYKPRFKALRPPSPEYDVTCLLYTSDAADEEDSVDLGGRRILKEKAIETIVGVGADDDGIEKQEGMIGAV